MKTLACKDLGAACSFVAKGNSNVEVIKIMSEHAQAAHADKMKEMSASMNQQQIQDMMVKAIKEE